MSRVAVKNPERLRVSTTKVPRERVSETYVVSRISMARVVRLQSYVLGTCNKMEIIP